MFRQVARGVGRSSGFTGFGLGSTAFSVAKSLREVRGFTGPLLLDAARYAGSGRLGGREEFSRDWVGRQRELGLAVLTDSGYIGEGDDEALAGVLGQARLLGDAIAV